MLLHTYDFVLLLYDDFKKTLLLAHYFLDLTDLFLNFPA